MELLTLLLIGLVAGMLAGLLGIGGGIIFTPVLYFLFERAGVENPVLWTIASGLFCTFIAATGSTIRQYIQHNFYLKEGLSVGFLGIIGITLGKWVVTSPYYDRPQFAIFFSAMLIYVAYMMFNRGNDKTREMDREYRDIGLKAALVAGGAGGFVASLAGVGGGGVMVPVMNLFFKQPFRKAVSVSQLAMVIMVFSGWFQLGWIDHSLSGITEYNWGYVDFGAALPLSIGGLIGGFLGAQLNRRINRKLLQWGFALLALIMAARLMWGVV